MASYKQVLLALNAHFALNEPTWYNGKRIRGMTGFDRDGWSAIAGRGASTS